MTATVTATTTGKAVKGTSTTTVTTTVSKTSQMKTTTTITYAQTTIVTTTFTPITSTTISTEVSSAASTLDPVTVVTTTVTTTSTLITTVIPTPDNSCNNGGLEYAFDYNQPQRRDGDSFSSFNADYYKTDTQYTKYGLTYSTGFNTGYTYDEYHSFSVYGQPATDVQYLGINQRGYIYAYQDGVYNFDLQYSDDVVAIWVGQEAYDDYTRNNAKLFGVYADHSTDYNKDLQYNMYLAGGTYTPFRIITANTGGPGGYRFVLTAPDGTQIASMSSDAASSGNYFVAFSCDGTSAPRYRTFGDESS